jgi:hypothetical protein
MYYEWSFFRLPGVGVEVAGQLLVIAGGNSDRLHSEAAFAHLCGWPPSRPVPGALTATGLTAAAETGQPTPRCTPLPYPDCAGTRVPAPT